MNKILLIDKPAGWTSFDVVAKIRGAARQATGDKKIKVGHAGTLDPFATGLLIVLVGKENTAKQDSFMKQDKEYVATMRLGFTSTTGDPEGTITSYCHSEFISESRDNEILSDDSDRPRISDSSEKQVQDDTGVVIATKEIAASQAPRNDEVESVLQQLTGEIEQIPPIYSAIKVDGQRAYKLAREGKNPEMKPRKVTIKALKIENYKYPELKIVVECSSGTYIRTMAEDIGKMLGTGAYLTALRRTKIGEYDIKDAMTIDQALASLRGTKQSSS